MTEVLFLCAHNSARSQMAEAFLKKHGSGGFAAERCPIFPGQSEKLHWPFPDPSAFEGGDEEIMARTRAVRDQIEAAVKAFIADHR